MASSDSQINKPQCGHPKRAEQWDIHEDINMGEGMLFPQLSNKQNDHSSWPDTVSHSWLQSFMAVYDYEP